MLDPLLHKWILGLQHIGYSKYERMIVFLPASENKFAFHPPRFFGISSKERGSSHVSRADEQ